MRSTLYWVITYSRCLCHLAIIEISPEYDYLSLPVCRSMSTAGLRLTPHYTPNFVNDRSHTCLPARAPTCRWKEVVAPTSAVDNLLGNAMTSQYTATSVPLSKLSSKISIP